MIRHPSVSAPLAIWSRVALGTLVVLITCYLVHDIIAPDWTLSEVDALDNALFFSRGRNQGYVFPASLEDLEGMRWHNETFTLTPFRDAQGRLSFGYSAKGAEAAIKDSTVVYLYRIRPNWLGKHEVRTGEGIRWLSEEELDKQLARLGERRVTYPDPPENSIREDRQDVAD